MIKKIYSLLLGGAVALAAFAATEFVGNYNVNDPEPASSYPEQLWISWANWATGKSVATPLVEKEAGVYEGVIKQSEFATNGGNSKIEFICLTANQDNWSVTYTPTEQATLSMDNPSTIANETIDHMPGMSGKHWDIRELTKLSYDLVFTANLNTHKLTVTKYEAPQGGSDTVEFVINGTKTDIEKDGNGVYTTTYQQLTNEAVDFTIDGKAGQVPAEYGLYTISYTYGAEAPTVTQTKAYTVKPGEYEGPTFKTNNNNVEWSFTAPDKGYLYDGDVKVDPETEVALTAGTMYQIFLGSDEIAGDNTGLAAGTTATGSYKGAYAQEYTFTTSTNCMGVAGGPFSATVFTPAEGFAVKTASVADNGESVYVAWDPILNNEGKAIENVTYTVYLVEATTRAIDTYVWKSTPDAATNATIPVKEGENTIIEPEKVYNIYVEATWATGTAITETGYEYQLNGIEGITVDGDAVYFDLNGRQVVNPEIGLYIRVANGKAQKMIIRK